MYFLIHCSEDGDISVDELTRDALLERIHEKYYGDIEFFKDFPEDDLVYWQKALIIKGNIVVPKPVQLVEKYVI